MPISTIPDPTYMRQAMIMLPAIVFFMYHTLSVLSSLIVLDTSLVEMRIIPDFEQNKWGKVKALWLSAQAH
ncbi:hypothetical protein [Acetobacter lambici]|uniref:hypothetical protein n=1 Tax=Acetobacter lambici TaxID=1332824 RepID=UPI0020A60F4E|nr:hypothetical protein [Acetobacter lambici]MCP1242592.1 hypothetical protein [Acetobacter lambici]